MKKIVIPQFPASETIVITSLALEMKARGETVYSLSAGEPMVPLSPLVARAIARALKEEKVHYPPVAGIPELRKAAAVWMNREYSTTITPEETLVVPGAKFGLYLLFQALIKKGDEVLVLSPYWVSYPHMVRIFKGKPITVTGKVERGWKVSAKEIKEKITTRTKMLILNNGANPTGVLYTKNELKEILALCKKENILVVSDEVYSGLTYDKKKYVSCGEFKEYKNNLVIMQSCSKNFALTGLRIGFLFAKVEILKALSSLTSQSTSGVSTISQYAALAALQNAKTITPKIRATMQKHRDIFVKEFYKIFKQKITIPNSALYAFIPLSAFGTKEKNSVRFCYRALKEAHVALVPGSAFGQEGYVRISFSDSPKVFTTGLKALARWLMIC